MPHESSRVRRSTTAVLVTALLVASAAAAALTTPSAQAAPVTVAASADAYVRSDTPTTNYGTRFNLAAKQETAADPTSTTSYVRFAVSNLVGAPSRVLLRVFTYSSHPGLTAWSASDDWVETTITAANAPAMTRRLGDLPDVANNTWTELDVTEAVTGNGVYSFGITTASASSKTFASRETGSSAPQLVIESGPSSTPTTSGTASPTATDTASPTADPSTIPTGPPTDTQTSYAPTADGYVRADQPDAAFGSAYTLFAEAGPDNPEMRSYLTFRVAGLPGPVTSARLRLFSFSTSTAGIDVASTTSDWNESGLTWTTAPAPGSHLGSSGPITLNAWAEVDVGAAVTGDGTYSFAVTTTRTTANKFSSREAGSNRPTLVVTTSTAGTPSPTPSPTPRPTRTPRPTPSSDRYQLLTACPNTPRCWIYTVRRGDNVFSIAHYFGVSTDAVYSRNPWLRNTGLRAGQQLRLPPPTR